MMEEVRADPLVREVLERFPGAEIVAVRERSQAPDEDMADSDATPDESAGPADDED